jgi:hypothetical protein
VYKLRVARGVTTISANKQLQGRHGKLLADLKDVRSAITILKPEETKTIPTDIIDIINTAKTADNTVSDIAYSKKGTDPFHMTVQGIAKSRQSLQQFTTSLQAQPQVASVNLPVSNFAKENNIEFTFEIVGSS